MTNIHSYEELKNLTDKEVYEIHDHIFKQTSFGVSYYQQEIFNREQTKLTNAIKRYTIWILILTIIITIATILNYFDFIQKP